MVSGIHRFVSGAYLTVSGSHQIVFAVHHMVSAVLMIVSGAHHVVFRVRVLCIPYNTGSSPCGVYLIVSSAHHIATCAHLIASCAHQKFAQTEKIRRGQLFTGLYKVMRNTTMPVEDITYIPGKVVDVAQACTWKRQVN